MRQVSVWVFVAVLFGVPAVRGEERLRWKFKEGDKFFVENVVKTKQAVQVMGQNQKQNFDMTAVYRITVKKKTDTETVLEQEVVSAEGKGEGVPPEIADVAKKVKGAVFTITLGPDNKVKKFEGYDNLVKKLAKEDEKAAKMFRLTVPEKTFKEEASDVFSFLPAKPVSKGDKWERTQAVPMGPLGTLKVKNQYTFLGQEKGIARIGVTGQMSFAPPEKPNKDFPLKLTKGTLKKQSYKGTILFDPARGRLVKYNVKIGAVMALTAEAMGQTIDMDLDMDMDGTARVLSKPPPDD